MSDEWRPVVGYEGLYEVSNTGKVRSLNYMKRKGYVKELKPNTDKDGYKTYALSNGKTLTKKAHRLVAKAFIPNPDAYPIINHLNGIKDDNRVENLEWCTRSHNSQHSFDKLGREGLKGEANGASKLIWEDVNEIKRLLPYYKQKTIAEWYDIPPERVSSIAREVTWKHVPAY